MTSNLRLFAVAATLSVSIAPSWSAPAAPAKPTHAPAKPAGNPKADPAAYALLEAAHNARQVMPADFPGFDADIVYRAGGKTVTGKLHYRRGEEAVFKVAGLTADEKDWLEDQVLSVVGHRRGGDFAKGDGRNPLHFGGGPGVPTVNSFGKLIELDDAMKSSYRVRDNKVMEVTRTAGDTRFTITVMDTMEADPGKYLASHFAVAYRDSKTGDLQKVDAFLDDYEQVGKVWLPASREVITFGPQDSPQTRSIDFKNIVPATPAN